MLMIGIDADDTLWHNERLFSMTEQRFVELVSPWTGGMDVAGRLLATERRNLASLGYGVKSFVLSMIETAIDVTDGAVPTSVISEIIAAGRAMIDHPVELLEGVADVVAELTARWTLVLITKGDLFHQESKIARSGLVDLFDRVEIVSEKDAGTFARIVADAGFDPSDFVMVGDSMRSDIVPALAIGGRAIHVPGFREWELERAEVAPTLDHRWWRVVSIREVPAILARLDEGRPDQGRPDHGRPEEDPATAN
ncbi:MAG: HAD family hydrolase [Acidimicrobiales bacterium]